MEITGQTILTGLLGSPVGHSISPMMHNEAFKLLNLDYRYLAFDVDCNQLKTAVNGLKALNARGYNLTMPDKNEILAYVDIISPAVKICGAANTVVYDKGILTAYTTDGIGYMKAVKEAGFDIIGKKMTLLGAGGAASAIITQAALDGVKEITVFSRRSVSYQRMEKLIVTLSRETSCKAEIYDIADETQLKKSIDSSTILTNATNVGMGTEISRSPIKDESVFYEGLIVSDIIYNPIETELIKKAKQHGCKTFNGLYMLLYQGAEAFRLWTGEEMPVDIIKEKYFI